MKIAALTRLEHNARRAGEIVAVFAKYGLADWLKNWHYEWIQSRLRSIDGHSIYELPPEKRMRLAFLELGPTFIKLGQMLSTRPELVGPATASELAHLQTETAPDSPEIVEATITAELGKRPKEIFAEFSPTPLASASIAQAHLARLQTGEEVVVKVQHAGILAKIQPDLDILAGLAELADHHAPQFRPYQPVALAHQFRRTLLRELDFTSERRNLEKFATNFKNDPTVHFPRTYPEFSGRRILTMEKLNGILGGDLPALNAAGADLCEFAKRGANMYLQMIFRDGLYHADPHPGNIMYLPGCIVGVLDCGMVGRLEPDLTQDLEEVLVAVANPGASDLPEIIMRVGSAPPGIARDQFRAELADFVAEFTGPDIDQLDLKAALNSYTEIFRRYHIAMPPAISLLVRTIVELEGTAQMLNPKFSLAEVMAPFYQDSVKRRMSPRRIFNRLRRSYNDWDRLLSVAPRDLGDILRRTREGTFSIEFHHRNLDSVINRLVLGLVTAALIVGSSLLWSDKAPPTLGGISVIGAVGYMVAVYLGWRLLRAAKKAGDLNSRR